MNSKLIFCAFICWITNVECLLKNISRLHQDFPMIKDGEPCVRGRMYRIACNTCHCVDGNALYCTKMACLEDHDMLRLKYLQHTIKVQKSDEQELKKGNLNNQGSNKADKPKKDLRTSMQGNEQKKFKKDPMRNPSPIHGVAMINKDSPRAHPSVDKQERLKTDKMKYVASDNGPKKNKKDSIKTGNEKKSKKGNVRSRVSEDPVEMIKRENDTYLPTLPNGPCVPGKIYRKECAKCFCNDNGKSTCGVVSKTGCNDYPKPSDVTSPNDVIAHISNEVYWKLPILAHSAAMCKPGKMYMVTCNACLCLDNGNLLCEQLLCVDQEEMNYSKAKKWSGSTCKKGDPGLSTRCVRCQCENGMTSCRPTPGCVEPNIQKLHGDSKARISLDTKREKCDPGIVYRVDCNFCYCQPNRMLRCTRKSCLNYRQSLMLKKQRSYLEKHGL